MSAFPNKKCISVFDSFICNDYLKKQNYDPTNDIHFVFGHLISDFQNIKYSILLLMTRISRNIRVIGNNVFNDKHL